MTGYGQFCSMARAHEVLGGRWTLLIVREILCGSRRFNDIRRGIPRVSRIPVSEAPGLAGVVSASVVLLSAGEFASPASVAVVGAGAEVGAGAFRSQD